MIYHILNGDALAAKFPDKAFAGKIVIMREALIDGPLDGNNLQEFWQTRAWHHETTFEEYKEKVVSEIEKLVSTPEHSEFNLWFGHDLFCQANMWFLLSIFMNYRSKKNLCCLPGLFTTN